MTKKIVLHPHHNSLPKRFLDTTLSFFGIILLFPIFAIIAILIKLGSSGPTFFKQKRVGKDGGVFELIKFRTMSKGAESKLAKLKHLNEVDGPVFKIRDDPRFVGIGKYLARTGLDELPQLINVIKGEMCLVGPRPLPISEARKLTKSQKVRELIKPGITSSWVVEGSHGLSFEKWMQLDRDYMASASLTSDISILLRTAFLMLASIARQIKTKFTA